MDTKKESGSKPPLLSSRQIGIAASLGGLGFAWRALGLSIPLPIPMLMADIRPILKDFGGAIGGPWVAMIICILGALPTPFPPLVVVGDFPARLLFAFIWKNLGAHKLPWKTKWLAISFAHITAEFIFITILIYGNSLLGLYPFWPTYVALMTGVFLPVTIIDDVILIIAMRGAKLGVPTWRWF